MDGKVTWRGNLAFDALGDSGKGLVMDSASDPAQRLGPGPMELVTLSLAGCTAMDVISILQKKQEHVDAFHVHVHAERSSTYPKVITGAVLEYVVTGRKISESSLRRAIELSVKQYCPVHAMLTKAFPIDLHYSIYETMEGTANLVRRGRGSIPETGAAVVTE